MQDSIFTKIIKGEVPAEKIYEDEKTIAILTIEPVRPGHALVIPKVQVDHLWDLEDQDYQAVWAAAKKVANKMRQSLVVSRVGVKVEGVDVPHVHVHLIPFNTAEDFNQQPAPANPDELKKMAQILAVN